jgi:MFS family permease
MNTNTFSREQKEAVFILSIGTFLEYFDLMLYIHMAVLLNELFFPQADPLVAKLLAAFAFCSTYVFRPIGGFIIGWIGDHVGRKNTIIITTLTMALCCVTMASVRTYAEIGITSAIVMVVCRMLQGFSSLGEAVGAELYLTETLKQPNSYVSTGIVGISARIGGLFALAVASLSMSIGLNWRLAFWIGAGIALIGLVARVRLRETPEFIKFKIKMERRKELLRTMPESYRRYNDLIFTTKKPDKKTILSYFMMFVSNSVCFYLTFIYCGNFMKESLGLTPEQIINQNLRVTMATIIGTIITTVFFVRKYHPLKIVKIQILLYTIFLPAIPYWLSNISNLTSLSLFQFAMFFLALNPFCMQIPCFKHIPLQRRFTTLATTFGLATALANVLVTFSLIPLTNYLGYYGVSPSKV